MFYENCLKTTLQSFHALRFSGSPEGVLGREVLLLQNIILCFSQT